MQQRDLFREGLERTKFSLLPSEGTFFQCAEISDVSDMSEAEFCRWLTIEIGVTAIPMSAFYRDAFDQKIVRFCFAKEDVTLRKGLERLAKL